MNLNINYSPNAMGEMLLQRLKDDFGAAVKNFTIQGDEYLKIVVTEKGETDPRTKPFPCHPKLHESRRIGRDPCRQ